MHDLHHFFEERHFIESGHLPRYDAHQWGAQLHFATQDDLHWEEADVVLLGCEENRNLPAGSHPGPDAVRAQLYQLYNWQPDIRITDLGNIRRGATEADTRAALRMVLHEILVSGKRVILLGGGHDLTLQQYEAFKKEKKIINATVADMLIDLEESEAVGPHSFLMDMLTGEPNFIRHYTHLGFQSYHVNPHILETLDKLRFDFVRLGRLRQEMEEAEPVLRASQLFSLDMNAVRYSDAPANTGGSPNGLGGDDACQLMRYAGMSEEMKSTGMFGFDPARDKHGMTAQLMAQMIWYFVEGMALGRREAPLKDRHEYAEFHVRFTSNDTTFLKSKRTGRWWMQLPDNRFVPCSYADYLYACKDKIPERWLREQERVG